MSVVKKQIAAYYGSVLYGILLAVGFFIFGCFAAFKILTEGIGIAGDGKLSQMLHSWATGLMASDPRMQKIVPLCYAGVFMLFALYGFIQLLRLASHLLPSSTLMGKSLKPQREDGESLRDLLRQIDEDLDRESVRVGDMYVGREWIVGEEAMRIRRLRGIYTLDCGDKGFVLALRDKADNWQLLAFKDEAQAEQAEKQLRVMTPNVETGDTHDYKMLTDPGYARQVGKEEKREAEREAKEEAREAAAQAKLEPPHPRQERPFSCAYGFVGLNGVPTSNYDWDAVERAARSLGPNQAVGLSAAGDAPLGAGCTFTAMLCGQDEDGKWLCRVDYTAGDEEYGMLISLEGQEEAIARLKRLHYDGLVELPELQRAQ